MTDPESEPTRRRVPVWAIAFGLGFALALAVGYPLAGRRGEPPPLAAAPARVPVPPPVPAAAIPAAAAAPNPLDAPIPPAGTLELSRANLPASGKVVVKLALAVPSADGAPRKVRIFSATDPHGIQTQASLDPTLSVASLELDPGFLMPGNYFVEIETTEPSHAPVRRYAIVVR